MKQKLFKAASLVALLLVGASCSEKQSQLDLNSIEQKITISGTVTYSTGVDVDATTYSIINNKPAIDRTVFIDVPYAQYSTTPGATAPAGIKIFETKTDENGKFSITIPTKSAGITATIRMEEFTDIYRTYEKMGADGKPIFKEELKRYTFNKAVPLTLPGSAEYTEEIVYVNKKIDVDLFKEKVTLKGQVNLACETGFHQGKFEPAKKANVEFTVIYDKGVTGSELELKYGTTTDNQGNYTITIPMKSLEKGFDIKGLKVLGIGDTKFSHYTDDSTTVKLYGAYELKNFGNIPAAGSLKFGDVIDGIEYNLGAQNLLFTPYYNATITDAYKAKPEKWDDKLIGWAAGMAGFDESYSQTATLTGKVYMPYLTAFGEGAYKNESRSIVLKTASDPYKNGFTVITAQDGSFSVDIPVKDDNKLTFTASLSEDDEKLPFNFIDSKSKVTILRDGLYNTNSTVKAENAEWYQLGDIYFHYTPDGSNTPDEWNKDLIGWYREQDYNKYVSVKGKMLFAVENSFGTGSYVAQPRIVTVTATQGTNVRTFAIKTNAVGAFDFMLPLKDEHDQPALAVTSTEYSTNEFAHYPKFGSNEIKLLAGKYTRVGNQEVYADKDAKEAWNNLGTSYMYVAKGSLTHTQSTYHDDLAGWFLRADNQILWAESKTATGVAMMAKETGYLTGEYVPANGEIVTVTLYSNDATNKKNVSVLTKQDGSFSVNVPLKHEGDDTELSASGAEIEVENFVHYPYATGDTKILEGKYKGTPIKASAAKWNEIGTVYYQFTPTNPTSVNMWNDFFKYISGWVVVEGREVRTQSVSGDVKLPVETSFRNGSYTAARNFPVKITVKNGTEITTYVTATDTLGHYEIPVWQKFAGDDEEVTWSNPTLETDKLDVKFKHFRKAGTTTYELLKGKYQAKETQEKDGAKWYEKGTRYYKFTDPTDATQFTNDLAGWVVRPKNTVRTISVSGTIKQACEKIDGTSVVLSWEPASNKIFKITIGSYGTFKIATNSGGAFSVSLYDTNKDLQPTPGSVSIARDTDEGTYFENSAFIHYTDKSNVGSKTTLPGEYNAIPYSPSVVSASGPSYNFGTSSFKLTFEPAAASKPSNWNSEYNWSSKYSFEE